VARKSEIPEEARSLIDQLVEQRLLATDISQATGEQTIEPAHEALLRQWGQLQGWLAEDAGLLSLLEGIKRATRDWVANGKDEAWLTHVTGRLVAAERLRQRADLSASLDRTEWDYLKACRQREDTQIAEMKAARKRRRRLELSLVVVLLVTSCAGTIYAAWTNYDYLEVRAAMLANELWPTKLSHEAERNLAQINLQPGQIISFRECTMCPEMVVVPAGSFDMGSPPDEKGRGDNESPQHRVTIQNNYAVGKFEVTFEEWDACVKARVCANAWDQGWGRGKRPVINVSWHEAQQYVQWLAERIGKVGSYRLLSEAEWEYAARGGKPTAYYFGEDEAELGQYAWYGGNSDEKSKPVGGKLPNAFGLFDMHGNVWEWVEDCYHKNYAGAPIDGSAWTTSCEQDYRIHRSGSWYHPAQRLRAAFRGKYASDYRDDGVGLRVARTLSID
jgi:formylglycine-generating enzyme required for sulfatase activity